MKQSLSFIALFVILMQQPVMASASSLAQSEQLEEQTFQNAPHNLQPHKMYVASYDYLEGADYAPVHVPEDLGKAEEMKTLIQSWKHETPDSLNRVIKNLVIKYLYDIDENQ